MLQSMECQGLSRRRCATSSLKPHLMPSYTRQRARADTAARTSVFCSMQATNPARHKSFGRDRWVVWHTDLGSIRCVSSVTGTITKFTTQLIFLLLHWCRHFQVRVKFIFFSADTSQNCHITSVKLSYVFIFEILILMLLLLLCCCCYCCWDFYFICRAMVEKIIGIKW